MIHRIVAVASALVCLGSVPALAATITFDSPITTTLPGQPTSFDPLGRVNEYVPAAANAITLTTQGFNIGTFTNGVPNTPVAGVAISLDPAWCPPDNGSNCVDNGTDYLAFALAISFSSATNSPFPLTSFAASSLLETNNPCPDCNLGLGLFNAAQVRVYGFRAGQIVAQQVFALGYGFQNFFTNSDPDWMNLGRVVFEPLDAGGAPGLAGINGCCFMALDDITTSAAVPEPASVFLLGTGLASLLYRRRRRSGQRN